MRIFIHGNDRGNAMLSVIVLILVLSAFFITLTEQINVAEKTISKIKTGIIKEIEQQNREAMNGYDLY